MCGGWKEVQCVLRRMRSASDGHVAHLPPSLCAECSAPEWTRTQQQRRPQTKRSGAIRSAGPGLAPRKQRGEEDVEAERTMVMQIEQPPIRGWRQGWELGQRRAGTGNVAGTVPGREGQGKGEVQGSPEKRERKGRNEERRKMRSGDELLAGLELEREAKVGDAQAALLVDENAASAREGGSRTE
eukprot:2314959-Pleurochrysis_carterae.AAC.3